MRHLFIAAILVACTDPSQPPADATPDATADSPAADPACVACPECTDLDAICTDVESHSTPLICDDGAVLAINEFTTLAPDGAVVTCRCDTPDCGPAQ